MPPRTDKRCDEPGCDKPHMAKGKCSNHYQTMRRIQDRLGKENMKEKESNAALAEKYETATAATEAAEEPEDEAPEKEPSHSIFGPGAIEQGSKVRIANCPGWDCEGLVGTAVRASPPNRPKAWLVVVNPHGKVWVREEYLEPVAHMRWDQGLYSPHKPFPHVDG